MIVRITFLKTDGAEFTMLFGNSYKHWSTQYEEYICRQIKHEVPSELSDVITVEVSKSKWKSWGGLKWCASEDFQQELNREGRQEKDADNPKPRQYADMKFYHDSAAEMKVGRLFDDRIKATELYRKREMESV